MVKFSDGIKEAAEDYLDRGRGEGEEGPRQQLRRLAQEALVAKLDLRQRDRRFATVVVARCKEQLVWAGGSVCVALRLGCDPCPTSDEIPGYLRKENLPDDVERVFEDVVVPLALPVKIVPPISSTDDTVMTRWEAQGLVYHHIADATCILGMCGKGDVDRRLVSGVETLSYTVSDLAKEGD